MKRKNVTYITQAAVIGAIYVCLVLVFNYISFGPVQFRIAEMLVILPYFTPAAIPGLFVGCLVSNIMGGAGLWDVVFGSLATLIGAVGTYGIGQLEARRNVTKMSGLRWLAPLPPILANMLIIPLVLKYAYGSEGMLLVFVVTVGIGEIVVCGVLGMVLLSVLGKYRRALFMDI